LRLLRFSGILKEKTGEPMTDPQIFIDKMLEVENLTDALEDEEADILLNWGVEQLKKRLVKIEDNEAAGEYTNTLMGFMRMVNQIAGDRENIQQENLVQLAELRQKAFGLEQELAAKAYGDISSRIKGMSSRQAVEYLIQD
jgi:hypothetical protein